MTFVRLAVVAILSLATVWSAKAQTALSIPTELYDVDAKLFAASGTNKRPAVIILHGTQSGANGLKGLPSALTRYAAMLAGYGIDAYLISYYDKDDLLLLAKKAAGLTSERATDFMEERIAKWNTIVGDVVSFALRDPSSSGRIGLLGFSQGGYLAFATAGLDPRISAVIVLYGGLSPTMTPRIKHLPPRLDLHGDADDDVALADGQALVNFARELGGSVDAVIYPGAGHAFDFDTRLPASGNAAGQILSFFHRTLF